MSNGVPQRATIRSAIDADDEVVASIVRNRGDNMKITGLQTHLVKLPGTPTLAGIPDKAHQYTYITLQLRTDEGVEGIGMLVVPQRPGLGLEFDPEILKRYAQ
ncbi:MAG: hypothetical protein ACXWUU_08320 [Burkholderiales bacterium]